MDNQNQNANQNDPQKQNPQRPEQGAGGDKSWNQPGSNPGQGGQKPGGQQGGGQQGGGQTGKR